MINRMIESMPKSNESALIGFMIKGLICIFIMLLISYYITIIVHELGHLVFGLITGYKFLYFRVANIALIKTKKTEIRKHNVSGSAGQCLLIPPEKNDSYFFMMAGGIFFNLVFGLASVMISVNIRVPLVMQIFLRVNGLIQILTAILNAIPRKKSWIENDGLCIKNLYKSNSARKCNMNQMIMIKELLEGKTYSEMDESLFYIEDDTNLKNDIIASTFLCNYYRDMEKGDYVNAYRKINVLGIYKEYLYKALSADIEAEIYFCNAVLDNGKKNTQNCVLEQLMENGNPYYVRINAVLAIIERNKEKLNSYVREFATMKYKHLYKGEVTCNENILMQFLRKREGKYE